MTQTSKQPAKIYFDNAATSWPKPNCVLEAVEYYLKEIGANPGRSGHSVSLKAARLVYETRELICELFNASDPLRVIFCANVTEALNLSLKGLLYPGDHVITSSMEHNSMMRPLRTLERAGVELTVVPCSPEGLLDSDRLSESVRQNTRMIALNHASNVVGTLLPVAEAGKIAREHNLLLLVDTAQTAGAYPIDMQKNGIDLLAFTGHKSLYGLPGTGGLIIGERVNIKQFRPMQEGGTGSRSELELQPAFLPDKFESGTPNFIGIAALKASIEWLQRIGVENIYRHKQQLATMLLAGLKSISDIQVYGTGDAQKQLATVSFNIKNQVPSDIGMKLDEQGTVLSRVGLHCAPAAHKTICTFPAGTIRFSLGYFNNGQEIERALESLNKIIKAG